jgi:hypothetical protein
MLGTFLDNYRAPSYSFIQPYQLASTRRYDEIITVRHLSKRYDSQGNRMSLAKHECDISGQFSRVIQRRPKMQIRDTPSLPH